MDKGRALYVAQMPCEHKAKILTKEDIKKGRSSTYKYLDLGDRYSKNKKVINKNKNK